MKSVVGFDQKITLAQMDAAASLINSSYSLPTTQKAAQSIYSALDDILRAEIRGDKSRKNAITVLVKIWRPDVPDEADIWLDALRMWHALSLADRVVLHWGLSLLAYPFFSDVVSEIGSYSQMKGDVASPNVMRKIKAKYGDRRRVEVATTAVLSSICAWGIVRREKGNLYVPLARRQVGSELRSWLAKIVLYTSEYKYIPITALEKWPALFPFESGASVAELISAESFSVTRQIDDVLISLSDG